MKKILFVLFWVVALSATAFAYGEPAVDLSDYTLEQLEQLHNDVLAELEAKGYSRSAILEVGKYTAGVDLPTGTYTIELSETADPDGYGYFNYTVYDENGQQLEWDSLCHAALKITLSEGYALEIERSPVRIRTFAILWQ